jgi:hypothetical protein
MVGVGGMVVEATVDVGGTVVGATVGGELVGAETITVGIGGTVVGGEVGVGADVQATMKVLTRMNTSN